jgi:hypothetical protein
MRQSLLFAILVLSQLSGIGQSINRIEYFFDTDPGYGAATAVTFSEGSSVTATFNINTTGLSKGIHYLLIRAKNENGKWSTVTGENIYVMQEGPAAPVAALEYFIDADPGYGSATQIAITPGTNVPAWFQINVTGLTPGIHYLCVRAKDDNSHWSVLAWYPFIGLPSINSEISKMEYFIDTDPGFGDAVNLPITPGNNINTIFTLSTTGLADGLHHLFIRARTTSGTWSILQQYIFSNVPQTKQRIACMEYFIGTDPGFGDGIPVSVDTAHSVVAQFSVDTTGMVLGVKYLVVRVKDEAGNWSIEQDTTFTYSNITRTWTGAVNDDWIVSGNWSPSGVPSWNDEALIPAGLPNMPVIRTAGLSCKKVVIAEGGVLSLNPGIFLTITGK